MQGWAEQLLKEAAEEFAPGIPARDRFVPIPSSRASRWRLAIQEHRADRAGCFVEGTSIQLNTGYRPIQEVQEGDQVSLYGRQSRVVRVWYNGPSEDWLRVSDGISRVVICTPNHPFWVVGLGWVPIEDLMGVTAEVDDAGRIWTWKKCHSQEEVGNLEESAPETDRQTVVARTIRNRRDVPGRDRTSGRVQTRSSEDCLAEVGDTPSTPNVPNKEVPGEVHRGEQLPVEGRRLERETDGVHGRGILLPARTPKTTGSRTRTEVRVVRNNDWPDHVAPHHPPTDLKGQLGREPGSTLRTEVPHPGGSSVPGRRRGVLRIERLPRISRGRYDLEIEGIHCYLAGGFLVHNSHLDVRLVDDDGHAHSWAIRGDLPKPGEKVRATQQPTHTGEYAGWSGTIPSGYGKGVVRLHTSKPVDVLESGEDKLTFVIPEGRVAQELTLIRTGKGKDWLLLNHSTTPGKFPISHHKPPYRERPFDQVDPSRKGTALSAKIDGAHSVEFLIPGKRPRVFSYRESKRGHPLEYTFKLPLSVQATRWPKDAPPLVIRSEVAAVGQDGRTLPESVTGSILNAGVDKARSILDQHKARMVVFPLQVEKLKGREFEAAYNEHLEYLRQVQSRLPGHRLPPLATTPAAKKRLIDRIQSGDLKETSEGVVEWDLISPNRPVKSKLLPDFDIKVTGVFPEKRNPELAGGFTYTSGSDPFKGHVGTGFSERLRRDMWSHPEKYKGMVARVTAQYQFPSGALRAPSFQGWHIDKNEPGKLLGAVQK